MIEIIAVPFLSRVFHPKGESNALRHDIIRQAKYIMKNGSVSSKWYPYFVPVLKCFSVCGVVTVGGLHCLS